MAGVVPNVGEVEFLKAMLGVTNMNATMTLKLFTNNITPGEADTAGSYTGAAGFGYADKTLAAGSWTVSTDGGGITSGVYALQAWTFTGALGNVYGYFVVRADTGILLFAERFSDGPYPISFNGDIINVTPKTYLD